MAALSRKGVGAILILRKSQPHNYAAMPTPEGRQARAIILRAVAAGHLHAEFPCDHPQNRQQDSIAIRTSPPTFFSETGSQCLDPSARPGISRHL
jgi:hypothetical protein